LAVFALVAMMTTMFMASSRLFFTLVVIGASAGCVHQPAIQASAERPKTTDSPALALNREVVRVAGLKNGAGLWPGFDPLAVPLAVFDGKRTWLFRHSQPPAEFTLATEAAGVYVQLGRNAAVTANTSADIGGVSTATLLLGPLPSPFSVNDMAAVAIHEAFHVYQRAQHPSWIGNEADLFTYPTDRPKLLALRRLETAALRLALSAEAADEAACWARKALALRETRYSGMDAAFAAYERGTELNEGLASYVEMRAAGRRGVELPAAEFAPAEVRKRAYATGLALALLLDRFTPGWPASFAANARVPKQGEQTGELALARSGKTSNANSTTCRRRSTRPKGRSDR
jgi:hypothetical protein